jgi:cytochrome c peroxidase
MEKISFKIGLAFLSFMLLGFISCQKQQIEEPFQTRAYDFEIPYGFPTDLNIPADNPMTVEGVALGRYLFYDGRISGRTDEKAMSCSSCHLQKNAFEAGIDNPNFRNGHPRGVSGEETHHVTLPLMNLVWNNSAYGWNGYIYKDNLQNDMRNIEDIVRLSVTARDELNSDTNTVKRILQSTQGYPDLFQKAFGSNIITFKNVERAIAQFVRTLVSANSKFDKYLRGEEQLSQSELNGFVLFTTEEGADCFHCHGGGGNPLFTTHLFYNNGKETTYQDNFDRLFISGDPMDRGAYKATSLRNIELQAPYMHDGRFNTLEEVIDMYSNKVQITPLVNPLMHHANTNGVQLTEQEKQDLLSFLHSLKDVDFITNPEFSKPESFPGE